MRQDKLYIDQSWGIKNELENEIEYFHEQSITGLKIINIKFRVIKKEIRIVIVQMTGISKEKNKDESKKYLEI